MEQQVAILGVGVVTPTVAGVASMASVCGAGSGLVKETTDIAPPEGMTPRDQRRLARLTRLALQAADQAAAAAGVRGRNAGIYVGLTHGTATFLKEFHDYLFDYGPEMASPNAFSNGVTNAPLGAISLHQHLTEGGATLVGLEDCGLEVLQHGVTKIADGTHEVCYCGATEEYSPIVEDVYRRIGWYCGEAPEALPRPLQEGEHTGIGVSEGSAFAILAAVDSPLVSQTGSAVCTFRPVEADRVADVDADLVISGAGGGPHDVHELELLRTALTGRHKRLPVLFPKRFFGETFAVGPMLSLVAAWDILTNDASYPLAPVHQDLSALAADTIAPSEVASALILSANREGAVSAGLLALCQ